MQNQQLPFPINSLAWQFMHIDLNNLSHIPPAPMLPQELLPIYPLIVGTAMETIQNTAQNNELRVFAFNVLAQNGFNNTEFAAYIEYCCRVFTMNSSKGGSYNHNQIVTETVQVCLEHVAALMTLKFPALNNFLDPNKYQACQQVIHNYNMFKQEVDSFFNRSVVQPFQQQGQYPHLMQQNHIRQNAQFSPSRYGNNNSQIASNAYVGNSNLFNNGAATSNISNGLGRYDKPPIQKQIQTSINVANIQQVTQPIQSIVVKQEPVNLNKAFSLNWMPSEITPYTPCYDLNKQEVELISVNGITKTIIKQKDKNMDIAAHFEVPSNIQTPTAKTTPADAKLRLYQVAEKIDENTMLTPEMKDFYTPIQTKECVLATFDDSLGYVSSKLITTGKKENKHTLIRVGGISTEDYYSSIDISSILTQLNNCRSLADAAGILRLEEISINSKSSVTLDKQGLNFINCRLTKAINNFMRTRLAIPTQIDNFIEDAGSILNYVQKTYGTATFQALKDNEKKIIQSCLEIANADLSNIKNEYNSEDSYYTKEDLETGVIYPYFFCDYYTLVGVDVFAREFALQPSAKNISNMVIEHNNPLFYKIAENIILHAQTYGEENAQHYVKTLDGVIYEITQGAINKNSYLVRVV